MSGPTLYDLLGCSRTASSSEIRKAYLRSLPEAHPDKGGSATAFAAVQHAYSVLADVSVNSASTGNPATTAWGKTLSEYVANDEPVPINSVSPPPPPGAAPSADYSSFLLPSNLTQAPVVTVTSTGTVTALPSSTLNQVGQAFSLLLADAIARGSVDTAADLFYQSMLRTDTLQTSAIVVNSMVEVSGCEAPLTFALKGAYDKAAAENATSLFTMALRNVQSNIGGLASCLNSVAPASEAEPEDSADGPAEAFAPGPSP